MKYIIIIIFLLPVIGFSQTKTDAEHVMGRFTKFYNADQYDSIYNLFSAPNRNFISKSMKWSIDTFGVIRSFAYLGIDKEDRDHTHDLFVFKTNWSKGGKRTTSFQLNNNNKFLTFRLITSSPGINKLLHKKK